MSSTTNNQKECDIGRLGELSREDLEAFATQLWQHRQDALLELLHQRERNERLELQNQSFQAQLDYWEMTPEQREDWRRNKEQELENGLRQIFQE